MATTSYLTRAELETVIGRAHLLAAAGTEDETPVVDTAAVDRAIADVSARVDARLRAHYELPLTDVPDFLRRAVARIVHAELTKESTSSELIQSRAAAAEKLVRELAGGALRIGADLDGSPATPPNARTRQGRASVVRPARRQFARRDTSGVV